MRDYTKELPQHTEKYVGEHDLFLEIYAGANIRDDAGNRPPLLFVHGAYTGSWMWSKYIPHYVNAGWTCYVMNLRSHYRSRVLDMSVITFEDYLHDIREIIAECGTPPVLIGFSMGGILGQKLAETAELAGLVLIDSSLSKEVHELMPYQDIIPAVPGLIVPAPARKELASIDESAEDIAFQRKYLSMESAKAFSAFSFHFGAAGISVDSRRIACPGLVIHAVNSEEDDRRGRVNAGYFAAEYKGLWNTTHTGLLVGQRYLEPAETVLNWLAAKLL
ncbi:alpha/beta fold hydrolase [Paenibacillus sp. MMS20-IR301]|uniref:alpha/beta hydrolase n=1 Tax=Paenibacillus sp. MMS20-IR301 TaxID=2895946 RepID=UPI0028F08CED|nr:alpha/beta fold hydrolase [Paenibacillus sp. MMS20-IR301]WNS43419.1 alpha/beta fold hydrolase [Paenibacillus sp. MMS20-IR301]